MGQRYFIHRRYGEVFRAHGARVRGKRGEGRHCRVYSCVLVYSCVCVCVHSCVSVAGVCAVVFRVSEVFDVARGVCCALIVARGCSLLLTACV